MSNKTFCHLHLHNEFSYLDGYGSSKEYAKRAKEMGFEYLALTNHGNIDGLIDFQTQCEKQGIVPIFGCEIYVVKDCSIKDKGEKRKHLVLLVKNQKGWEELCKILTHSNLYGFYSKPRIGMKKLMEMDLSGFVITSACIGSVINGVGYGDEIVDYLLENTDFYLEVMPHDMEEQFKINEKCLDLLEEKGIPLVATNDCHYIVESDSTIQEILLAVNRKAKWNDPNRWKFDLTGLHLRSGDEMAVAFKTQDVLPRAQYLTAMRNTIKIAKKCCGFRIKKQKVFLPELHKNPQKVLADICHEEINNVLYGDWIKKEKIYRDRLKEELMLIAHKGFAQYFLIVKELIDWCKENGIMTGVGRGSVGGSLVAYLLGITRKVDPIKYNLLFSRFINMDRIDLPDIDIDFEDRKRHLVREHLELMYGKNNVSGISTFSRMKGRGAIRDLSRVFDVYYPDVDAFAKVMKQEDGDGNYIELAAQTTKEGRLFAEKYPQVLEYAIKIEGQVRGVGQHAAAVVVSKEDLTQGTKGNLCLRKGTVVSNWGMQDSEEVGLMKLDILGLNTLSVLNETKRLIDNLYGDDKFEFEDIELEDPEAFKELAKGNTVGVFQLHTYLGTDICKRMKVDCFEDIVAAVALTRPGALDTGMNEEYVLRKHGKEWVKKNDIYERITKDTFGTVIYQEQVMEIIHVLAGLNYSVADRIRKVIGKKRDATEFEPYKIQFVEGCLKEKTFSEEEALDFWEDLLKWANYGFNRSHSVEYAVLAYWTAWCKVYFPLEFICANLTYGSSDDAKKIEMVREARRKGLTLVPPKVGISDAKVWITKNKKLFIPFNEIKGVGDKTAEKYSESVKAKETKLSKLFVRKNQITKPKKLSKPSKIDKVLDDIAAYDPDLIPETAQEYFSFPISEVISEEFEWEDICLEKIKFKDLTVLDCKKCGLNENCKSPVPASSGTYNVMIIGEAPNRDEDKKNKPLVGAVGDILWNEFLKYGIKRRLFHITNAVKCYPKGVKKVNSTQIETCSVWLREEIKQLDCQLILSLGNTPLQSLSGREGGVTRLNGTMEWVEDLGAWVCYCLNPASVLHGEKNRGKFQEGIKFFVDKFERLRGEL
jgi:DNA polymerase III subunit alpha